MKTPDKDLSVTPSSPEPPKNRRLAGIFHLHRRKIACLLAFLGIFLSPKKDNLPFAFSLLSPAIASAAEPTVEDDTNYTPAVDINNTLIPTPPAEILSFPISEYFTSEAAISPDIKKEDVLQILNYAKIETNDSAVKSKIEDIINKSELFIIS